MFRILIGISLLHSHHLCQLLRRLGYRPTFGFWKIKGFINSQVVSSLVTLVRNVQGYTRASPWDILEVTCTNNMFMVQQVVVLWLYMTYKLCVIIYFSTKIYFIGMGWVNQHYTNCSVNTILLKTPVQLPTFLFSGNYISLSFAFIIQHQHLS